MVRNFDKCQIVCADIFTSVVSLSTTWTSVGGKIETVRSILHTKDLEGINWWSLIPKEAAAAQEWNKKIFTTGPVKLTTLSNDDFTSASNESMRALSMIGKQRIFKKLFGQKLLLQGSFQTVLLLISTAC